MSYNEEAYEQAVNDWFKELKDIQTNDLLRMHLNKYPEKRDYEIKEDDQKEDNEQKT